MTKLTGRKTLFLQFLPFVLSLSLFSFADTSIAKIAEKFEVNIALQEAEVLQAEGKIQEAISAYEEVLKSLTSDMELQGEDLKSDILMKIASCYSQLGDDNSAIQTYLKIISDNPNSISASSAMSLMMNLYIQRYRFDELLAMSRQISQQFPGTEVAGMAVYRIANFLYSQNKTKEAIQEFEAFLSQFPNSIMRSTALSRLISLYIAEGMFEPAERKITDSLAQNPDNVYMLQQLALVYRRQGKYDKALELYDKILAIEPDDIGVFEDIGELYAEKGDKERALIEWSKITQSAPEQYSRYQMLANILKSHGFYEQAIVEYQKAIKLQPQLYYLSAQLAELYIINKQFSDASDVYLDILTKLSPSRSGINQPERSEITKSMVELCKLEGLYDEVISKLKTLIAQSPSHIPAILTLADVYFYKDDISNALEQFKYLASLYPDDGATLFERAQVLRRERRLDHAIQFYQTILDLFPNSNTSLQARMHIGQLFSEQKRPQEAIAHLRVLISQLANAGSRGTDPLLLSAYKLVGDICLNQMHDVQSALSSYREAKERAEVQHGVSEGEVMDIYLRIGECFRLLGQYDMVESLLSSIPTKYRSYKSNARIAKLRGDCYFSQGDFDNAKVQYKESVRGNMNEDWANDALDRIAMIDEYSGVSQELLSTYAQIERLKKLGQYSEAENLSASVVRRYANNNLTDRIRLELGDLLSLQAREDEAISAYEELIQAKSPLAPEACFRIAQIYWQKKGDRKRAIETFSKLIEDYPDSILVSEVRKQIQRIVSEETSKGKVLLP